MSLPRLLSTLALVALIFPVAGCSGGGSGSDNAITSVIQDIGLDPDGLTTVVTFASDEGLSGIGTANFESDGGQSPVSIAPAGDSVAVVWSARVTSADQVRVVGRGSIASAFHAVTPSSTDAPTFTIQDGTQTAPLGGDSLEVHFDGAHVIASEVADIDNWTLSIDGTDLDLTGTTVVFDTNTQVATFTLGTLANLHATFSLAAESVHAVTDVALATTPVDGTASGDAAAPTIVSAAQNLAQDEFGRVVDFTFSEPMDPVFSVQVGHFGVSSPDIATAVETPTPATLRVTFNNPIVPGVNSVQLTGLLDAHGNAFPDTLSSVAQGATVANGFASLAASTVANTGGDKVVAVTTQAFDPDSAVDPAAWNLIVDGNTVDLSTQTFDYDLSTKTLTITLDFDMQNGDAFSLTGLSVVDVDGDPFTGTSSGTIAGDLTAPTITSAIQNRNIDVTGKTVVVQFSEDVDQASAENLGNWSVSGTQNLTAATRLAGGDSVRLVFDAFVVPGDVTLDVQNVSDLAGNSMLPSSGIAIGKTDSTRPNAVSIVGTAIEGTANDLVSVVFDDDMIPSEIEDPAHWTVDSPVGTSIATTGDPVSYDTSTRTAVLTLQNAGNLQRGTGVRAAFTSARDISGNVVTTTAVTGSIQSETNLPEVTTVWRDAVNLDQIVVVFSEPVGNANDLYDQLTNPDGARYVLRTSGGTQRGLPTTATTSTDLLAVRLSYGFVVNASDTLDVIGVVDMCGNPAFPDLLRATVAEVSGAPGLAGGMSLLTTVTGENNDTIEIVFDRPMNPFQLTSPSLYAVSGPATVDLSRAQFSFDGNDTVTVKLRNYAGHDLLTGSAYSITASSVWSAQGNRLIGTSVDPVLTAGGDGLLPDVLAGDVRIDPSAANSLLITANEALYAITSQDPAYYDYDGGNIAISADRVGLRTVRVGFAVQPLVGQSITFSVTDLAGNSSGSITRTVAAADTTPPLVSSVSGVAVPGLGGDMVRVVFDEQVQAYAALAPANYTITNGTRTLNPSLARATWDSATRTVTMTFHAGQELDASAGLTVTVQDVPDFGGNIMPVQVSLSGSVSGDTTAPTIASSFVNWRLDPSGKTVDVLFSEDVDVTTAGLVANWSATGGPTVSSVSLPEANHARVVLSTALGASATVRVANLADPAANATGLQTTDPLE